MQNIHEQNMIFFESSYGTSQTSKLELFTKKVNGFYRKTISAKSSPLDVWEAPK